MPAWHGTRYLVNTPYLEGGNFKHIRINIDVTSVSLLPRALSQDFGPQIDQSETPSIRWYFPFSSPPQHGLDARALP